MKKLFLFVTLLFVAFAAGAQAYVGGTLGIAVVHASADGESQTNSAFSISPEAGYYFNKTWAVGANLALQHQNVSDTGVTTFSILPYVRANFAQAGIFDFFGELALGYSYESIDGHNASGFASALRPGFIAHLSDRFSLVGKTTLLSYNHYDGVNGFGFAINSNFELGVQVTF